MVLHYIYNYISIIIYTHIYIYIIFWIKTIDFHIIQRSPEKKSDVFSNFPRQKLRQSRSRISFNWSRRRTTTSTSTSTTSTDPPFRRFPERRSQIGPRSVLGAEQCLCQTWEIPRKNGEDPYPMTDPAGAGRKMLTLSWGYIDGIHGTPYIAYMDPMGIKIIWKFRYLMGKSLINGGL